MYDLNSLIDFISYRSGTCAIGIGDGGTSIGWSYSQSRGLLLGTFIHGAVIFARQRTNERFYGLDISISDVLNGIVEPPRAAEPLYDALRDAEAIAPGVTHSYSPCKNRTHTATSSVGLVPHHRSSDSLLTHPRSLSGGNYASISHRSSTNNSIAAVNDNNNDDIDDDKDGFYDYTITKRVTILGLAPPATQQMVVSSSPNSLGWKMYTKVARREQHDQDIFNETGGIMTADSDFEDVCM